MTVRRFVVWIVCLASAVLLTACDSVPAPASSVGDDGSAPTSIPVPAQPGTAQAVAPADTSVPAPPTEVPAAARVNGEPISLAEYQDQVAKFEAAAIAQGLDPNTSEGQAQLQQVRENVLNGMIDQRLIEQEARRKGIVVSDADFEAAMQEIIAGAGGQEAFVTQLDALGETEADFRQGQRSAMLAALVRDQVIGEVSSVAPQVHARHILIDSAELGNSLLAQLQAGADFASLAQQYSQDTLTSAGGGDLGWFPRGWLISREVEDAAFSLQAGQYSGVVQSAFGFHLVQTVETEAARPLTPEQLLELQRQYFERWMQSLRSAATIEK